MKKEVRVRVLARVRPLTGDESECSDFETNGSDTVRVARGSNTFRFDRVLDRRATQGETYQAVAKQAVDDVINGFNATVFVYGQTGSGKTHTMFGDDEAISDFAYASKATDSEMNITETDGIGLVFRAARSLFSQLQVKSNAGVFVELSFLEIYNERIYDLLRHDSDEDLEDERTRLKLRETPEGSVVVDGLVKRRCQNAQDVLRHVKRGALRRATHATGMNARSSRSHAVVQLHVTQREKKGDRVVTTTSEFNLADLAGSERTMTSFAVSAHERNDRKLRIQLKQRQVEMCKINQSLTVLGRCVTALSKKGAKYVPFRDSVLTFLLRNSLSKRMGNGKTTLLVTLSPSKQCEGETLSTLRFAASAKTIRTVAEKNTKAESDKEAAVQSLLAQLQEANREIQRLRRRVNELEKGERSEKKTRNNSDDEEELHSHSRSISHDDWSIADAADLVARQRWEIAVLRDELSEAHNVIQGACRDRRLLQAQLARVALGWADDRLRMDGQEVDETAYEEGVERILTQAGPVPAAETVSDTSTNALTMAPNTIVTVPPSNKRHPLAAPRYADDYVASG